MNSTASIDGRPIGAVVVTYLPDAGLTDRLRAIRREFAPVVVVDNSDQPEPRAQVAQACRDTGCELLPNPENLGLAGALNRGFHLHADRGLAWAAAFDQDSVPRTGFGLAMVAAAQQAPAPAVVGANWTDDAHPDRPSRHLRPLALPFVYRRSPARRAVEDVTCVIASGSLFQLSTWRALGGFDEDLFLDLVDTDYCLRAARSGRAVQVAEAARLRHRRGAKRPVQLAGRTLYPAFMPPLRLRYLFRNRIRVISRHGLFAPHLVTFELLYTLKIVAEIAALEDQKAVKIAACVRGFWDGVLGRSGRIVSPAP